MSEKLVIVGVMPDVVVLDPGEQAVWISNAGNIKVEFDPQRCPFSSNVLQAPAGVRLIPHYDRTELIDRTLHNVRKNMIEGIALVQFRAQNGDVRFR